MGGSAKDVVSKDFIVTICREAGQRMLESLGDSLEITRKGELDLVTQVDVALQEMMVGAIRERYPDHSILGEEGIGEEKAKEGEYTWLIDPLDGTTNYVHGYPVFCVSVALAYGNEVLAGAIFDPLHHELFYAEKGQGATLNDRRISVSSTEQLISSLLSTGFPYQRAILRDNNLAQFNRVIPRIQGVRRSGSVALDLGYVAAGRLDGHWELHVKPWDTGTGGLLIEEAGGRITTGRGGPWNPFKSYIVATNGKIHDELLAVLMEVD